MQAFVGTLVDTPKPGEIRIRRDHLIVVNDTGYIDHILPASSAEAKRFLEASPGVKPRKLGHGRFLIPTFADLHLHAPQFLFQGLGLDLPLMQWLDKYAYRAEERIDSDPDLARRVYAKLAERLKMVGTGCAVLFGTIGVEANLILADAFQQAGVRAFVGKLSMDMSPRPTYGEPSCSSSLESLNTFLDSFHDYISEYPPHLQFVRPIITPRFVPVCSEELLRGLAKISKDRELRVQSHMCESHDQMQWVENTRGKRDEVVFDEAGLLRPGNIQAHVTSFPEDLRHLCKQRGVVIAHCPLSNAYFSDAQFPLREALNAGLQVGLGSDIAGGYALSIQTSMRSAVYTSRLREGYRRETSRAKAGKQSMGKLLSRLGSPKSAPTSESLIVDWKESLYVATRGGKSALGMGGAFEVGMEFDVQLSRSSDAILLQFGLMDEKTEVGIGAMDFFDGFEDDDEWYMEAIEKWWCNGDERNRSEMWTQGKKVLILDDPSQGTKEDEKPV